ncbi:MAG: 50S ribosomal protein L16 [Candidatus Lindowbacteria bacterium RIFCSPLOWO2_12_FULL_62_27]|nr:ribosomal protein L16 [uncultured bacterium]OGH59716.1 MAG: 50S ribosomal protein L16 [Candidatus Lindowbacteria bacterium RIFCSPLOWO2_12_FULL_62_27]
MLMPAQQKFRKQSRGRMRGMASRCNTVAFGEFGLKALDRSWVTSRQIEAVRIALSRYMKRKGKVWIRIFPDKPVTMRPAETRMGTGKGNPEFWVAVVRPGQVCFEVGGLTEAEAAKCIRLAGAKLPMKSMCVRRRSGL